VPAIVGLPHGLSCPLVFGILVVAGDFADDDFGIERNGLEHDVEALAVLVRECKAEVEPVVVLALALDHRIGAVRRLLRCWPLLRRCPRGGLREPR
jgi:hypothetical protein